MKNKVFKNLKSQAVDYFSKFPIEIFNRFTKEDLQKALGKDTLDEHEELPILLKWAFDNCRPILINLQYHIFDIQLVRSKEGKIYRNKIITRPKFTAPRLNLNRHLADYRVYMIQELEIMTEMHNTMCDIFQFGKELDDIDNIPSIREFPDFGLTDFPMEYIDEFADRKWSHKPLTEKQKEEMLRRAKGPTIPF